MATDFAVTSSVKSILDLVQADVIKNLIFISKIRTNDLVDTHNDTFMPKGMWTSLYRTFLARNESRLTAYNYFAEVYHQAFLLMDAYTMDLDGYNTIRMYIEKSRQGLLNHMQTYNEDSNHTAKILALIDRIDRKLKD